MAEGHQLPEQSVEKSSNAVMAQQEAKTPETAFSSSPYDGARMSASGTRRSSTTRISGVTPRRARSRRISSHHADETFSSLIESHHEYQWRMFAPKGVGKFLKWLITGHAIAPPPNTEQESKDKIDNLARTLSLLRDYEAKFGMPNGGSKKEQEWVLEELCKKLFASGVPIWVLQPVMGIAAQGLTGLQDFDFFLLPTSGIIIPSQETMGYSTLFYQMQGGFCLYRINMYEKVLARLASFCTNTRTMNSVPDKFLPQLLMKDIRHYSQHEGEFLHDKDAVAREILDLASRGYGLFFLTRVEEILTQQQEEERLANEDDESGGEFMSDGETSALSYQSFWNVDETIRELFTRLATIEAAECLDAIDRSPALDAVWPRRYIVLFRALSSAGSSALWFRGSWQDMLLSGGLAAVVAFMFQTNTRLWKNQRMIFEVIVSFIVGLASGMITIKLPETTCFSAIALASMIDYLRGFGIVFSIMEVMSKNKMSGSSDFIEAVLFSFLISISILFGLNTAQRIMGLDELDGANTSDGTDYMDCGQPLPQLWFLLILPMASMGWAAGFKPAYGDLPLMTAHGVLAFIVSWAVESATGDGFVGSFVAALTTSTVAGLMSRFTGRQALGDTFTGLYALVPGIYITQGFLTAIDPNGVFDESTFFVTLILKAVVIGVGSWCGTLLCAPTNLGTNAGILSSQSKEGDTPNLGAVLFI